MTLQSNGDASNARFPVTDYRLNHQSRQEQVPRHRDGWMSQEKKPLAQLVSETKEKYDKVDLTKKIEFCERPGCDRLVYAGKSFCSFRCKDFEPKSNPELVEPHTEHCCMNMQIQLDIIWNGKITTSEDSYPVPWIREKTARRPKTTRENIGKGWCVKCMWRRGTEKFPLANTCTTCGGEPNHHGGCCKVPSSVEELCDRNQYKCDWFGPMGAISLPEGDQNTEERDRVYIVSVRLPDDQPADPATTKDDKGN